MTNHLILKKISIFALTLLLLNISKQNVLALETQIHEKKSMSYSVVVDLNDCKLFLINNDTHKIEKIYTIAGGKSSTPSPVGTWKIVDKGIWTRGFGTRWMGLNVPWGKYGIHGTNKPYSIGGATSQGCIRMHNKDVEQLYKILDYGTPVIIYGGPYFLESNQFRTLIPCNTGNDVLEVQRKLKDRGYYNSNLGQIW